MKAIQIGKKIKTNIYPRYFRKVLKLIHRLSVCVCVSCIHTQPHSDCAISQSFDFIVYFVHVCDIRE